MAKYKKKQKDVVQLEKFVDLMLVIVLLFGGFVVYSAFRDQSMTSINSLVLISLVITVIVMLIQTVILAHIIRNNA